jgi:hypothetical protein
LAANRTADGPASAGFEYGDDTRQRHELARKLRYRPVRQERRQIVDRRQHS